VRERSVKIDTRRLIEARGRWRRPVDVARALSLSVGLTRQKLWNYENGVHDVPERTLSALCALYGVEMRDLVVSPEK
jgi:hypothetical protein